MVPTMPAHLGPTWVTSCDDIIALLGRCDGTHRRPDPQSRAAFWRRAFLDGAWVPEHDCIRPGRLPPRVLVDCASPLGFVNRDIPPGRRQVRANRAAANASSSKKGGARKDDDDADGNNNANACPDNKTRQERNQKQPQPQQQQQRQCRRKGAAAYLKPNVSESRPLAFHWRDHRGADIRPEYVAMAYGHTWETACAAAACRYDEYERRRVGGHNERLAAYYARGRLNLLMRALRCSGQQRLPERPPDEDLTQLWRVVTCDRALAAEEGGEEDRGGEEKREEEEGKGKGKEKGKWKGKEK
ncbi:hypothetical protein N3K66_001758 [Trichothecium roseum]|uniref:Uncharacterized protein n=1 Tax=Trichothecium roseum TaxID=47278 RepID=A0ACC0V933_9HYPO|nr:hypothetical protein N3K66_001758 [Trichothecium roseum]